MIFVYINVYLEEDMGWIFFSLKEDESRTALLM